MRFRIRLGLIIMNLKTIVLYGPAQCGKTHCLNYLAGKLIKEPNVKLLEKKSNGNGLDESDNYYAMLFDTEENEVLVIVTTQGDFEHAEEVNYEFVQKYIKIFPEKDIYWLTASRTWGGTTNYISGTQTTDSELYWVCKGYVYPNKENSTTAELFKFSDTHTADSLFEILNHLVSK